MKGRKEGTFNWKMELYYIIYVDPILILRKKSQPNTELADISVFIINPNNPKPTRDGNPRNKKVIL